MEYFEKAKEMAMKVYEKGKNKLAKTDFQKTLSEATSNENWNASNKLLDEIAEKTYSYTDYTVIMKHIWKRLNSNQKKWRKILKTLNLIEYLIKLGAPRCIREFKDEMYQIRTLQDFSFSENGVDRGASIREKVKQLIEILVDDARIEEERENARKLKEKIGGVGKAGFGSDNHGGGGGSNRYDDDWRGSSNKYGGGGGGGGDKWGDSKKDDKYSGYGGGSGGGKYSGHGSDSYSGGGGGGAGGDKYNEKKYDRYGGDQKYFESTSYNPRAAENADRAAKADPFGFKASNTSNTSNKWGATETKKKEEPASTGGSKWSWIDNTTKPSGSNTTKAGGDQWGTDNTTDFDKPTPKSAQSKPVDLLAMDEPIVTTPSQPAKQPAQSNNLFQGFGAQSTPVMQIAQPQVQQPAPASNVLNWGNAGQPQQTGGWGQPAQPTNLGGGLGGLGGINFTPITPQQPAQPQPVHLPQQPARTITMNPQAQSKALDSFQLPTNTQQNQNTTTYKNFSSLESNLVNLEDLSLDSKKKEEPKMEFNLGGGVGGGPRKSSDLSGQLFTSPAELDALHMNAGGMTGGHNPQQRAQNMSSALNGMYGMGMVGNMGMQNQMGGMNMGMGGGMGMQGQMGGMGMQGGFRPAGQQQQQQFGGFQAQGGQKW